MNKVGRPKKAEAKKTGELNNKFCRYTFIAEKTHVKEIKRLAEKTDISIKDCLGAMLDMFFSNEAHLNKFILDKKKRL